ncbi:hypothetical protein HanXRQr2_Chr05g0196321 [Helianthus annuus]|uniref:Uncharacterized protein n=1 Tax=Helianthus annuus TaxID=4232 RepID=A0A9K3IWP8_HELAN|nr:uncharacterized protein LOC118492508 [Helianthus annuus]KAF5804378.1 hypothetical protein HanXRQr2_Chr05g0196321 [Helianthus annuus]KAJ0746032.1 hypothetical protein HanOQP8_Chr05g0172901 [Helianthus annuus]KAJ0749037.1 hypothetical protein HanLR1_Chr05g0165201 [Helianthus annuus]
MSVLGPIEVKARVENIKPNRSLYFTQKNQENTNESHLETNINEGLTMKRKFSIVDDNIQNDDLSQKCMRADQSHANQGVCNYDLDDQMQATRDVEQKFGCNISHLDENAAVASVAATASFVDNF